MVRGPSHERGEEILRRLLNGEAGEGKLEYELLGLFFQGYPLNKLRLLLGSSDAEAVGAGVWIAAEMGEAACELFPEVTRLLTHPSKKVRFFLVDYLMSCARPDNARAVAPALALLNDPESAVRWQMLNFLQASEEPLVDALRRCAEEDSQLAAQVPGLQLLVEACRAKDSRRVLSGLASSDPYLQKYAAAAAARLQRFNPELIQEAARSSDPVIRRFAEDSAANQKYARD